MPLSQNGWTVVDSTGLRVFKLPGRAPRSVLRYKNGQELVIPLRRGVVGMILCHMALYFHEEVESLTTQLQHDEWGWAPRPIRGSSTISNHASGTAMDLNATLHPLGVPTRNTFTPAQIARIHRRLRMYRGCLRWGGDYVNRPDAMHFEIDAGRAKCVALAAFLRMTPRGRRIRKVNPR